MFSKNTDVWIVNLEQLAVVPFWELVWALLPTRQRLRETILHKTKGGFQAGPCKLAPWCRRKHFPYTVHGTTETVPMPSRRRWSCKDGPLASVWTTPHSHIRKSSPCRASWDLPRYTCIMNATHGDGCTVQHSPWIQPSASRSLGVKWKGNKVSTSSWIVS